MEFNISQKTDPETKGFKIVIEGDKEFKGALNKSAVFFNDLMNTLLNQIVEIYRKEKQKPLTPTELTLVDGFPLDKTHTIAVNDYMADLIINANQEIIDKIVLIKDSNGKTLGLEIK